MLRVRIFLLIITVAGSLLAGLLIYSGIHNAKTWPGHVAKTGQLVEVLGLTDLSLSSEARYTRHPSQADLFSAFQDYPGSLEHFPTGSILLPYPVGLKSRAFILPEKTLDQ